MSETDPVGTIMKQDDVLSGNAGLAGIHQVLNGQSSRRTLRSEVQAMLQEGYHPGAFHLTRAKYKPGRKLLAYFTFPALDAGGKVCQDVHLAVAWQPDLEATSHPEEWVQLQEEARQSGLMPVQRELWRDLFDRGIRLQVWPFDPKFPQLIRLGNPAFVSEMFASLGITDRANGLPLVTPIRYRPKERHVLRYELDSAGAVDGQKRRLYAKLYSNAQDAERALGVANRVVDWLDSNNMGLKGVRPEAMSLEQAAIFYPHAPGIPLSHQFHRSPKWVAAQLHIIGKGLATLHNGPESLQVDLKQNTFANEAKVVKRASEHIQVLLPETYDKIIKFLETAQQQYAGLPQEKPTFTHADFKSDHILSTADGLTLIDFDTCTVTDPALDLGKFLADLHWWFTTQEISGVEEFQGELLKSYQAAAGGDPSMRARLARARLFYALILAKIVVRRVPLFKKDWATQTDRLIERATRLLDTPIPV